jgi:hypothetical protein
MHRLIDAPLTSAALFHSRSGGFPLLLCTYVPLDENGNDTADFEQIVLIRLTVLTGRSQDEAKPLRFHLREPDDIRRFLVAVGQLSDAEVVP